MKYKKIKKLPKFKNKEEELKFWDTANVFEYTKPVKLKLKLPPRLKKSTMNNKEKSDK